MKKQQQFQEWVPKAFQEAYEKSEFSVGDTVKIVDNKCVLKSYEKYVGMRARIIGVAKLTDNPNSESENGLIGFYLDIEEYRHFKTGNKRFPNFPFYTCEIEKVY